ncbi:hypothetical protein S144_27 [Shewanella sp. phage 1/44]|nr:hypothetical protein S144_27 [Shewanella sp. phage 1/44]AHK11741.1 hypothetical protein S144_27 [Shewanella sp. phage 1/44]
MVTVKVDLLSGNPKCLKMNLMLLQAKGISRKVS